MTPEARCLGVLLAGPRPLVVPSAWDAGTARASCRAGALAIAVDAADVAWSLGHGDGEPAPCAELVAACRHIRAAVNVPVLIDLSAPSSVREAERRDVIAALIEIGVAGFTIPSNDAPALLASLASHPDTGAFIEVRIAATSPTSHDELARRARSYVAAGASGVLLSSRDLPSVVRIARELRAPVSVDVGDGWAPPVWGLARIGVRGVRLGGGPLRAARALITTMTTELLQRGTYDRSHRALHDRQEIR